MHDTLVNVFGKLFEELIVEVWGYVWLLGSPIITGQSFFVGLFITYFVLITKKNNAVFLATGIRIDVVIVREQATSGVFIFKLTV